MSRVKAWVKQSGVYPLFAQARGFLQTTRWVAAGRSTPVPPWVKSRVLERYAREWSISTLVETGTYRGDTIAAVEGSFRRIYSIELDPQNHERVLRRFAACPHVTLLAGDSATVLPGLLATLDEPCLFWLDAHYSGAGTARGSTDSPIRQEVALILEHPVAAHVLLIDDAHLFTGLDGYPTLEELQAQVEEARPGWAVAVKDGVIRVTPPTNHSASPDARPAPSASTGPPRMDMGPTPAPPPVSSRPVLHEENASAPDLKRYLRFLRRRKATIALTMAATTAIVVVASLVQTPVYQGRAQLLLQGRSSGTALGAQGAPASDPARVLQTEMEVVKSEPVRAAVRQSLGSAPDVVVSPVNQSDLILVVAESTSPSRAADIANAYANAYLQFRRSQAVSDLDAAGQQVQAQIDGFQKEIDDLSSQIAAAPRSQRSAVEQSLGARRNALVNQQSVFRERRDQLQVEAAFRTAGAQVVTPASVPADEVRPRPKRNALLGSMFGLMLGLIVALVFELLDDSIRSEEDLELASTLPVLGLIPTVDKWRDQSEPLVLSRVEPASVVAEAYRTLRTSINFARLDHPPTTIQITSPSFSEGKTTIAANLGVVLAQAGRQVILVCCDLRRPRIHEFFDLPRDVGFTSVLLGHSSLASALQPVVGQEGLLLLPSGPVPRNPSELLSSAAARALFSQLEHMCDTVLIDSPPVLPVTDAAVLSSQMDATLLVAAGGVTTRRQARRAVELLRRVQAPLIGTVLNRVSEQDGYGYQYSYEDFDGEPTTAAPAQRQGRTSRRLGAWPSRVHARANRGRDSARSTSTESPSQASVPVVGE